MFIVTNRDFPNALSQGRISLTVCCINGLSSIINNKTANLLAQPVIGADYSSISAREDEYKKAVINLIQFHTRLTELSFLSPVPSPSNPIDEELSHWYELVDSCKVTPQPTLRWHHHPDGGISWTLLSISWYYTSSELENSSDSTNTSTSSLSIDTLPLPGKLDTPEARLMFKQFIEAGRIEILPDGHLKWKVRNNASKCPVALAYFITRASDYLGLTVVGPSGLPRYHRKDIESLFCTSGSAKKTSFSISADIRKDIDSIFNQLPVIPEKA